ncbi:MAG: glycosyltransferase [Thermoplasmatales archaeon]
MKGSYLEAMTSVYFNDKMTEVSHHVKNNPPVILMDGNCWPQKNLVLYLSPLCILKESGKNFELIISGGINYYFPCYKKKFIDLIRLYSDVIDTPAGYAKEKDIMGLFLKADLVVLSYDTPRGHFGILEEAIYFEVPTVVTDFPEYREEATNSKNVLLSPEEEYEDNFKKLFNSLSNKNVIKVKNKISYCLEQVSALLRSGNNG